MTEIQLQAKLEELRRWEVVDPEDAEAMANLRDALFSADGYLQGAGVTNEDTPLRDTLLRKMAAYFYEVRAPGQSGYPDLPPDLNALVLQLRH